MGLLNMKNSTTLALIKTVLITVIITACSGGGTGEIINIGGTVSNLKAGNTVVLKRIEKLGGPVADSVSISKNGTYIFAKPVAKNSGQSGYVVGIAAQPTDQFCSVSNMYGTLSQGQGDVANVNVSCRDAIAVAGNMLVARQGHTSTLLANGKVLVAGGSNATYVPIFSTELYDPASNAWSAAGSMATARYGHTATLVTTAPNVTKVLVAGGIFSAIGLTVSAAAELYDPASNTWSAATSMTTARSGHVSVVLANGKVLIAGGSTGAGTLLTSAELYDPVANTWSAAGNFTSSAGGVKSGVLLSDGRVFISKGQALVGSSAGAADIYNPTTNTWSATSNSPNEAGNISISLASGKVFVAISFGEGGMIYDIATNAWQRPPAAIYSFLNNFASPVTPGKAAFLLSNGSYIFPQSRLSNFYPSVLYNPTDGSWSEGASMPVVRENYAATLLANGRVLVTGGTSLSSSAAYPYGTLLNTADLL